MRVSPVCLGGAGGVANNALTLAKRRLRDNRNTAVCAAAPGRWPVIARVCCAMGTSRCSMPAWQVDETRNGALSELWFVVGLGLARRGVPGSEHPRERAKPVTELQIRTQTRNRLRTELCAPADLSPGTRNEMFALFSRAYVATDRRRFRADLDAKRDVLMLRDGLGRVAGFTTLAVFDDLHEGRPIRVVFSGDTLVDPAYWGSNALSFAWIRHVAAIKAEQPEIPLYWLLISKGFRTYRYLSTFANHYVPRRSGPEDATLEALRDRLAVRLFGASYDIGRGVVTHDPPRDRLATALAALPKTGRAAAEARFFAERNPGYLRGEELVCLCALEAENMRDFAQRLYRKALA